MRAWWFQVAVALDRLVNAICLGWSGEMLSSRFYRNRNKGWYWRGWYCLTNLMFFWQNDHCRSAFYNELEHRHLPLEMRNM